MGEFLPERLISVRQKLGIRPAEASRRCNLSKMGYGRYENGERTPSHQVIEYLAQRLGTSAEYLTGETDDPSPACFVINRKDDEELYTFVEEYMNADKKRRQRLLSYFRALNLTFDPKDEK
ncbi:MAG: helix-turn-helix transcriptional regulator [Lachnospiraceae bacterium]|nr:helix-turn-helix transcriptional regulator [Candidatus Merdinaster equi]